VNETRVSKKKNHSLKNCTTQPYIVYTSTRAVQNLIHNIIGDINWLHRQM